MILTMMEQDEQDDGEEREDDGYIPNAKYCV